MASDPSLVAVSDGIHISYESFALKIITEILLCCIAAFIASLKPSLVVAGLLQAPCLVAELYVSSQ